MARIIFLISTIVFFLSASAFGQANNIDRMIQLIDYVGIDYQEAVSNGQIINAGEYAEMLEFAATIEMSARKLTESPAAIVIWWI